MTGLDMKRPTAGILSGYGLRDTYGEGAGGRPSWGGIIAPFAFVK